MNLISMMNQELMIVPIGEIKLTRILIEEKDIVLMNEPLSNKSPHTMYINYNWNEREQLKAQILQDAEKAQKYDQLIKTIPSGSDGLGNSCITIRNQDLKKLEYDAKIVDEIRKPEFINHLVGKLVSMSRGTVNPVLFMTVIASELQQLLGEKYHD